MKVTKSEASHRKCYGCGHISADLECTECSKCGKYMYLVSQIYSPKVASGEKK